MRTLRWLGVGLAVCVAVALIGLPFLPFVPDDMWEKLVASAGTLLALLGAVPLVRAEFNRRRLRRVQRKIESMERESLLAKVEGVEARVAQLAHAMEQAEAEVERLAEAVGAVRRHIRQPSGGSAFRRHHRWPGRFELVTFRQQQREDAMLMAVGVAMALAGWALLLMG